MHFAFTPSDTACLNLLLISAPEWQANHAGTIAQHALDCVMRLARVRRAEHGDCP